MSDVVIFFGGLGSERLVSCASAQHFSEVLPNAILWYWQEDGSVVEVNSAELKSHQDVFMTRFAPKNIGATWKNVESCLDFAKLKGFILLLSVHGGDGENGWLQGHCEIRKIPFTGSNAAVSKVAMEKPEAKQMAKKMGVVVADQYVFNAINSASSNSLKEFQKKHGRIVLKPSSEGSSAGLAFLENAEQLETWLKENANTKMSWLCEEMLIGREFTIGVIMFRGCLMALPPSEVILERNARFDYKGKYLGQGNREITPAELSPMDTSKVQEVVLLAHSALGCYGYTRSEVILTKKGPYYLETNTLPGFTKRSFIPQQLEAAKIDVAEFVQSQIDLAKARFQ